MGNGKSQPSAPDPDGHAFCTWHVCRVVVLLVLAQHSGHGAPLHQGHASEDRDIGCAFSKHLQRPVLAQQVRLLARQCG